MIHLFDPENKFWQFMAKVTDMVCMSLLWLVTSLPIVTMGAATTSFYRFCTRQVLNTEGSVWKSYFKEFKRHFGKATLLWLIMLACTAFFTADLWAVWNYFTVRGGPVAIGLMAVCGCVALMVFSCGLYLFPLLAVFDFPLKKLLGNSFIMAMGNLHVTLTMAIMLALVAVGFYYVSGLLFLWVGLYVFFSSYLLVGVFLRYTGGEPEAGEEEDEAETSL